jgi:TRAP-type C4-dicarboxylate transport system permease large subunit
MSDPASRQAALIAAAALIGPAIPPSMVVNRPHEAATALTRMADLLLPWLEGELASPGTTRAVRAPQRRPDDS